MFHQSNIIRDMFKGIGWACQGEIPVKTNARIGDGGEI